MCWTINFFIHKAENWIGWINSVDDARQDGCQCYAMKQAQMYQLLAEDAQACFLEVNPSFDHIAWHYLSYVPQMVAYLIYDVNSHSGLQEQYVFCHVSSPRHCSPHRLHSTIWPLIVLSMFQLPAIYTEWFCICQTSSTCRQSYISSCQTTLYISAIQSKLLSHYWMSQTDLIMWHLSSPQYGCLSTPNKSLEHWFSEGCLFGMWFGRLRWVLICPLLNLLS